METENKPMEIGEDWFCYGADFDSDKPHIILARKDGGDEEKRIAVPEQLAYYLRTHWCGSQIMHDVITQKAKNSVTRAIREILEVG